MLAAYLYILHQGLRGHSSSVGTRDQEVDGQFGTDSSCPPSKDYAQALQSLKSLKDIRRILQLC